MTRLRVKVHTPYEPINPKVLSLIVPSYNSAINKWLSRENVDGIITSQDGETLGYTDAKTGKQLTLSLPPLAREASALLQQLGY